MTLYLMETTMSGELHTMKPLRSEQVLANIKVNEDRPHLRNQVEQWLSEDSDVPFSGKDFANRNFTVRKA